MSNVASTLQRFASRWLREMLLPVFGLSLLAAMWLAVFHQLETERISNRKEALANSQALARTLSDHVGHILRQTEHATQLFKLKYEETGGRLRLAEFARRDGLLDSVLPARLDLPMALYDGRGRRVDSANAIGPDDISQLPYFRALAGNAANLPQVSTPVVDSRTNKWQIQIARRLNDRAGQFGGVFLIMIDPMYFVDDYDRLNLHDSDALALFRAQDGLTVGRVGDRLFIEKDVRVVPNSAPHTAPGEVQARPRLDHVPRIYAATEMPRFGLSAVVGINEHAAMQRYRRHQRTYTKVAAIASLIIALVSALLMRQSAQLRASIRAARIAQATLRAASDGSLDGLLILRATYAAEGRIDDFLIVDINERGAHMLHTARADLLGRPAFASLPRLRRTGFFQKYATVLDSGTALEEEVELRFDGEAPRWIHHQIVPLKDGIAVTSRDITQRKLAEIEIRSNRSFLQSLIDHLPLLIYVKSVRPASAGTMVVWNKAAEKMTGYAAEQVIGQQAGAVFGPALNLTSAAADQAMIDNPSVLDEPEKPIRGANGNTRYVHALSVPLVDELGTTEYILGIAEDITHRREQEQHLRNSEAHLLAVTSASPLGLMRSSLDGRCIYVNRRFETITGMSAEQALGDGWRSALHPEESGWFDGLFAHQRSHEEPFQTVLRCIRPDGVMAWVSFKVAAVRIDGRIEGFVGSLDDITTLRLAEMALRESESRLRTIANTIPAMVAYVDAQQVYRFHNLAYGREFGRQGMAVPGRRVCDTMGEQRYRYLAPYIARALAGETLTFEETEALADDARGGEERTFAVTYIPQRSEDEQTVVGFHITRQDVSAQQREKQRLLRLAQIDPLTSLANRAGFLSKLDASMHDSAANGHLMALMYMDIDRFKPVNDTHGHAVGDKLLKAFAGRLIHALRESDTVARLGGDEFTIIMEHLAREQDGQAVAAKIVSAMQEPFELDGITVSISTSIGLSFYRDGEHNPDALLEQADMLLYQAKQAGRNTWRAAA